MPFRYLLDTNIASYAIKGSAPHVRDHLRRVPMAEIGISVITEAELRFGVARPAGASRFRLIVDEFLARVEISPWTSDAAQHYASLRSELERSGSPMGNLDMMIAAHALALDVTLVTHDRVFQRVKHLKVEDWTKP